MNDNAIREFYKEICKNLDGNYKIILESNRKIKEDWIEYDSVKWEMEDKVKDFVDILLLDKTLSLEEKIIKVYEFICLNYIYDANVLYFFKKDLSNPENIKYIAVDWYGRIVEKKWIENRKLHNRRVCYEFSRLYAKAINTLIEEKRDLEAFMLGDIENTHYVVALTGKEYSVILDQDDFNSIKDLTRLKMGLTIKGIKILKDEKGIFKKAVDDFNKDRLDEIPELKEARNNLKDKSIIECLNKLIKELNKYNIDSQGFFEIIRNYIEQAGIKIEKIWKEDKNNIEKRYERCLYFELDNKTYLFDSIDKTLNVVNLDGLNKNLFVFNSEENEYKYYGK